jgi:hypothetical protein
MQVNHIKYIKLGLGLGASFLLGRYIYRKIRQAKLMRGFGNPKTLGENKMGNEGGFSQPIDKSTENVFNPRPSAQALLDAMKGWGTSESQIWNTLEPLNLEQRNKVRSYFNIYFADGSTLFEWFDGDLGGSSLTKAKSYFN